MADEVNLDELEGLLIENFVPEAPTTEGEQAPVAEAAPPTEEEPRKKSKKHHKHKKRRRSAERNDGNKSDGDDDEYKRSKYVIDAAESGDSDDDDFVAEDDDEEEAEEGYEGMPTYEPPRNFIFHEGEQDMTADEMGREYEQRLQMMRDQKKMGLRSGVAMSKTQVASLRYASHLLPQDTDPKVFAVKCRPRMARVLVARIVNKCYAYRVGKNFENKKVDLGIISAFCLDHVKEYVYVEAYRKLFVENALNGLEGLFRFNITAVDPSELMQMMERRPSNEKVRVGSFVRLRQGYYRMDLAQVTAVHQDGVHITCKVVPREDFVGKPYNKPTSRLPPRFFTPSLSIDVEDRGDFYRWGDLRFDKEGYLLKVVSVRMAISGPQMEKPSTEELARFYNNNRERVREAIARSAVESGVQGSALRIGDSVRVASGQLRDTVGSVVNIFSNNNTATLSCHVPGRKEPVNLRVELTACVKFFAEGTHVVVEKGEHTGESGTVVRSLGDVVLIFPDRSSSTTELRVRANDCHQSKLVGSFGSSNGAWQLFDLVTITSVSLVACVVRLNNNSVDVLTEHNEVRTLMYPQIKAVARTGARQTVDRLQNVISRGSEVIIQHSPLTPFNLGGETGRVEQVYNRTLFVYCRRVRDNAGLVALDADCVLLTGGRTTTKQMAPPKQLPAPLRRPHHATKADLSVPSHSNSAQWQSSEWYEPEYGETQ